MTPPLAEERLQRILALLMERGALRTTEIQQRTGSSGSTVRRDLDLLAERGLIRKVHGGATLNSQDQRYTDRQNLGRSEKELIARLAITHLQPGQTVYLDAGTTCLQVAVALKRQPDLLRTLRVFTHGLNVAFELNGECALYVIGGENYGSTYSLTGPDALAAVQRHTYDTFLVGCTSIAPGGDLTNSNLVEARQKTAIMQQSRRTLLVADRSKYGLPGFATFAAARDVQGWITDHVTPGARRTFEDAGVPVYADDGA